MLEKKFMYSRVVRPKFVLSSFDSMNDLQACCAESNWT